MQSKQEDKENIEIFWRVFNKAYKEANNKVDEKFHPTGWCTDMASCNFIGLVKIYSEDVLQYIKGCEFHFRDSVIQHANKFGDESETFKKYALQLLMSSTSEAYEISCHQLKSFINATANTETCHHWLNWWSSRKEFIFHSFTSKEAPSSNLAEVIHAGWKHRERMGVGLVEVCLFDTRDSLLFESQIEGLATGFFSRWRWPMSG